MANWASISIYQRSSALAYARYVSSDFLWGPKVEFSASILTRHLYTRQLASEQSEGADFMTAQQRQGLQIKKSRYFLSIDFNSL